MILTLKQTEKLSSNVRIIRPTSLERAPSTLTLRFTSALVSSDMVTGRGMDEDSSSDELGELTSAQIVM